MNFEKRYYPLFVDLTGQRCLVVGAGPVGLEKAAGLIDCGADVTIVAPRAAPAIGELDATWIRRDYRAEDLNGCLLAIAATSDTDVNRRVYADAAARSLLVNVADVPDLCRFILPAVHHQEPIAIAVSTGGASPALAQRIKRDLAARYGLDYAELATTLRALRPWAKRRFDSYEERRDFFQALVDRALP